MQCVIARPDTKVAEGVVMQPGLLVKVLAGKYYVLHRTCTCPVIDASLVKINLPASHISMVRSKLILSNYSDC